jgi:hypothetical protein
MIHARTDTMKMIIIIMTMILIMTQATPPRLRLRQFRKQ